MDEREFFELLDLPPLKRPEKTDGASDDEDAPSVATKKLSRHRKNLCRNKEAYTADFSRVLVTCREHLKAMGYASGRLRADRTRWNRLMKEYVFLIARTQGFKPHLHVEHDKRGPFCWNVPGEWNIDYIRYYWGHLSPRSEGKGAHQLKNLCLQSARCNLHVQTALHMDSVREWLAGSAVAKRIDEVERRRQRLFQSIRWKNLVRQLGAFRHSPPRPAPRLLKAVPKGSRSKAAPNGRRP